MTNDERMISDEARIAAHCAPPSFAIRHSCFVNSLDIRHSSFTKPATNWRTRAAAVKLSRMAEHVALFADRFPHRANRWRLRTTELLLPARPLVMGIVNVTPDSFSDGGQFPDPAAAIGHGLKLAAAGADLLDIGGESTRPNSEPVPADEELRRVLGVVEALARQAGRPMSIDTSKAVVAAAAIEAGAEIINDVTALTGDSRMPEIARQTGAAVVAMHMQGTPQTMQINPRYDDVVAEVLEYLRVRRDDLVAAGIAPERIALDPGIGFGKTHAHNLRSWRLLAVS